MSPNANIYMVVSRSSPDGSVGCVTEWIPKREELLQCPYTFECNLSKVQIQIRKRKHMQVDPLYTSQLYNKTIVSLVV